MSGSTERRARTLGVAGIAVLALVLSACSSSKGSSSNSTGSASTGGSYQWGIDDALSGPVSFYGLAIANGVAAYVNQANAQGGINGKKIELTKLDSAGDATRAAANATQLASVKKVNAIFGATLSSNCSAAQPIVERYKVPMACQSVDTANPWIYNFGPDDSLGAAPLFAAAKKVTNSSNPKVALITTDALTELSLAKDAKAKASSAGVTLATAQQISLSATDVSQQVAQVVSAKPDAVLISHSSPTFASVLKGLRAASLNVPIIWLDGSGGIASLASLNDPNVYALSVYQQADPASADAFTKSYVTAVASTVGKTAPTFSDLNLADIAMGYMAAAAFGTALKQCGASCSGSDLQSALNQTTVAMGTMVPSFKYTSDSHYPYSNQYLYKCQGAQNTLVATIPTTS